MGILIRANGEMTTAMVREPWSITMVRSTGASGKKGSSMLGDSSTSATEIPTMASGSMARCMVAGCWCARERPCRSNGSEGS